jgi:hypothetical protein
MKLQCANSSGKINFTYSTTVVKSLVKRAHGRPQKRCKDTIKTDIGLDMVGYDMISRRKYIKPFQMVSYTRNTKSVNLRVLVP